MKLILKITAGILLAWGIILAGAFFMAIGTAKVVSEAVVEPQMEQLQQPFNDLAQQFPILPQSEQSKMVEQLDVTYDDCVAKGGIAGWNYLEGKASCMVNA